MMDFQAIRKEYEDQGVELEDLQSCPFEQLRIWLKDATENSPGSWFESNAMSLATAGSGGAVSVRVVLLKELDQDGIRFFTNYQSEKAKQIESNPHCSAVFHWPYLGRQVRISGAVDKTSREVSAKYFHSRPRGSQLSAAVSDQSEPIETRAELVDRMEKLELVLNGAEVPLPEHWGGYQLKPSRFEFWQGRTNRLHDRIVYKNQDGVWVKQRLAP